MNASANPSPTTQNRLRVGRSSCSAGRYTIDPCISHVEVAPSYDLALAARGV
jgi:hypothetical protein